jgi:hypothetical protein
MITINQINVGSGGVYIIKAAVGDDIEAFEKLVTDTYNSIDFYQSPSIMRFLEDSGSTVAKIKYFGLD